jgi:hypothetical protein
MSEGQAKARRIIASVKAAWAWSRAHVVLIASVLLCAAIALWLAEHDAALKRELALQQLRQQTTAEVAELRARAAAALGELKENARLIEDLESRRRALEHEAEGLRKRLSLLREEEGVRVQQAGTLAPAELAQRVAARLGPEAQVSGVGGQAPETNRPPSEARSLESGTRETGNWKMETGQSPLSSGQLPVASDNGPRTTDDSKFQTPESRRRGPEALNRQSMPQGGNNRASSAPRSQHPVPSRQFPASSFQFPLNEAELRQVETAFLQLDACREQSAAQDRLVANCEERAAASRTVSENLNRSVNQLQEAVRLKDEIATRTEAAHRAELKAARGTWRGRFIRALEYVAVGVVIGVVVR